MPRHQTMSGLLESFSSTWHVAEIHGSELLSLTAPSVHTWRTLASSGRFFLFPRNWMTFSVQSLRLIHWSESPSGIWGLEFKTARGLLPDPARCVPRHHQATSPTAPTLQLPMLLSYLNSTSLHSTAQPPTMASTPQQPQHHLHHFLNKTCSSSLVARCQLHHQSRHHLHLSRDKSRVNSFHQHHWQTRALPSLHSHGRCLTPGTKPTDCGHTTFRRTATWFLDHKEYHAAKVPKYDSRLISVIRYPPFFSYNYFFLFIIIIIIIIIIVIVIIPLLTKFTTPSSKTPLLPSLSFFLFLGIHFFSTTYSYSPLSFWWWVWFFFHYLSFALVIFCAWAWGVELRFFASFYFFTHIIFCVTYFVCVWSASDLFYFF